LKTANWDKCMERQLRTNGTVNTVVLLLAAVVTFAMGRYSGSAAGQVVAVFLALGFVAALVSRFQMGLEESERLEQLELEELARKSTDSALFKTAEAELRPARRAREQFEKYFGPGVAVVLLAVQWGGAWLLWQWLGSPTRKLEEPTGGVLEHAGVALAIYGGVGLVLFLFGKVAANLVRITRERLLRPTAGYVLTGAYLCGLVAAGVGADIAGYPRVDGWMARALVLALAVAGVENALTLILEIYRPRVKGAERRLLYESRLVGLASQPEGIFTTVAHALDYQFGFKVSETWFYQFLQKYLGLFLLAQLGLLLLSTCVVFIEPGEQAILERFGRPLPRLLDAGGHWKWPWPVDKVYRYRTDRIQTFSIGHSPHEEEEEAADSHGHSHGREAKRASTEPEAILWTEAHAKDEFNLLVASREEGEGDREAGQAVPVNLLAVDLPVQYQVTNLLMWATRYSDGAALLERVATREVVQYLVHADLNEILTTGRQRTADGGADFVCGPAKHPSAGAHRPGVPGGGGGVAGEGGQNSGGRGLCRQDPAPGRRGSGEAQSGGGDLRAAAGRRCAGPGHPIHQSVASVENRAAGVCHARLSAGAGARRGGVAQISARRHQY
jgi:hypothetical protein